MGRRILLATMGVAVLATSSVGAIFAVTRPRPSPVAPAPTANAPGEATAGAAQVEATAAPSRSVSLTPEAAPAAEAPPPPTPATTSVQAIERRGSGELKISFRLDARLTKGLHMGTRWVSPATYVGKREGSLYTVQARAQGVDRGEAIRGPLWLASQPDMVAVTPDRGRQVEIAVLREGRSALQVVEGDASKTLWVDAVHRGGVWEVGISQ